MTRAKKVTRATAPAVIGQWYEADVPHGRLRLHPENPRQGDLGLLMQLIRANGFVGALGVQAETGVIVWGNHRFQAGRALGMEHFPVLWLPVDDATALELLLADNAASDAATNDPHLLTRVLTEILERRGDLEGTGYTPDSLDDLLGTLAAIERSATAPATAGDTPERSDSAVRRFVIPCEPGEHEVLSARLAALLELSGLGGQAELLLALLADHAPSPS